jgi:hypothetical protein
MSTIPLSLSVGTTGRSRRAIACCGLAKVDHGPVVEGDSVAGRHRCIKHRDAGGRV